MPSNDEVVVRPDELLQACSSGSMRYCQDIRIGRRDRYGAGVAEHGLWLDIVGAIGETAVAKRLNRFHWGLGVFRGDDVGGHQVRCTRTRDGYLILHPEDLEKRPDVPFICVRMAGSTTAGERLQIQGWAYPRDVARQEFWGDVFLNGRPAFFVPPSALQSIDSLPDPHAT